MTDMDALQLEVEALIGRGLTCPIPWSSTDADPVADVRAMRGLVGGGSSSATIVHQAGAGPYCGECGVPVCEHVVSLVVGGSS